MNKALPDFSNEQWDFLSVLHAFGEPISIDIAEILAPISPGQFLQLLGRNNQKGHILNSGNENYAIDPEGLDELVITLDRMNDQNRLNDIVDRLYNDQLIYEVNPLAIEKLLGKLDPNPITAEIAINFADRASEKNDEATSLYILHSTVKRLLPVAEKMDICQSFIKVVIKLARRWFVSGRDIDKPILYLKKALFVSNKIGDKRSQAILNLLLSRYYSITGKSDQMWDVFSEGYKAVKELGDDEILNRTAPLLGINLSYYGFYKEAAFHLERIPMLVSTSKSLKNDYSFQLQSMSEYGICMTAMGNPLEASGIYSYGYIKSKEMNKNNQALGFCIFLGNLLITVGQFELARNIIEWTVEKAEERNHFLSLYFLNFILAYMHFLKEEFEKSHLLLIKASNIGSNLGATRYPIRGGFLEMLFELENKGFPPVPKFDFNEQIETILKGVNINLKGVLLRLEAIAMSRENKSVKNILSKLKLSEKYLEQTGDIIQLGKTLLELGKYYLNNKDEKNATVFFEKAYHTFSVYAPTNFPEDLKHMLKIKRAQKTANQLRKEQYAQFMEAYGSILMTKNRSDTLFKVARFVSNAAGAERAALFWFDKEKNLNKANDVTLYNMTSEEIENNTFKPIKTLINKALTTKKPYVTREDPVLNRKDIFKICSRFILPIEINEKQWCVLYMDNIFFKDQYDGVDPFLINNLIKYVAENISKTGDNENIDERSNVEVSYLNFQANDELQFQSQPMMQLISKADKVAATGSNILITGETGTGKELLAQRIHKLSTRNEKPFIVVDLSGVPENLLESELFGHEKGAFTGAHQRKKGRMELAHQGTVFLDEIGEIPLSFQTKLLRILQEGKFMRLGGSETIYADFRLIAATNRNLEEEVNAGRFRQDLYYRLNVMPFSIPPLRERQNDILLLARYFTEKYTRRYNKTDFHLTAEDESLLMAYSWPGNVRELKNVIERAVILSSRVMLNPGQINTIPVPSDQSMPASEEFLSRDTRESLPIDDFPTMDEVQRRYIRLVLEKTQGKISGHGSATEILGMKRTTLYHRLRKLGVR